MAERGRDASMERIRAHVREQVARTSLRKVATRAGVKVGATKKFVDGSEPYERNARLWRKWYAREMREGTVGIEDALSTDDARIALEILLTGLSDDERDAVLPRAAAALRALFRDLGHAPPQWASELAEP